MLKIKEYKKAESLQQAYELNQKKNNVVLGGMLWLKMQNRNVGTAIDLSGLGLDRIEETEEEFRIGSMVSLRQLEQHEGFLHYTGGASKESLRHIVGVQFRSCATVGGSIYGRFGFSDVLTLFLAMDSYVELYHQGVMSLEEFAQMGGSRDILVNVILKKESLAMAYQSQRNTSTDFPVLTCCVAKAPSGIRCVMGARPQRAVCFKDEKGLLEHGITPESAEEFAAYVQEKITVGSNMRAGAQYRKKISRVLVRRALLAMEE